MPVRSLNSSVLRWPSAEEVLRAARAWAAELRRARPEITAIFCTGSLTRADYGVGSDADIVVIAAHAPDCPVERRRLYEPAHLPVPADLWVYTTREWDALAAHSPRLRAKLDCERIDLV